MRRAAPAMLSPTLVVLAKAPVAGRSKTRLAPVFGEHGAALLAAAALQDTLDAVAGAPAGRRLLVLAGDLTRSAAPVHVPAGFDVIPQAGGSHADRIAAALAACTGPALLIGMDTPQVTHEILTLHEPAGAWLGLARDGGWWALGLADPARYARAALQGVAMSTPTTGVAQFARLHSLRLAVTALPGLRDVDEPPDARAVAAAAPDTRFAAVHHRLLAGMVRRPPVSTLGSREGSS
jgi:uncharacterized protein